MIVALDTSKWRPLTSPGTTPYHAFYNPTDGTYCALGLLFRALGMSDTLLARCGFLEDLGAFGEYPPEGLTPALALMIMEASDEPVSPLGGTAERAVARARIERTFAQAGVDVVFA